MGLLQPLLVDQTTKKNIVWATDVYRELGSEYGHNREILPNLITGNHSSVIKNRARKAMEQQSERTRKHAEVFTPLWVCKKMISYADAMWFGKTDPFLDGDAPSKRVSFPKRRKWQRYVDAKRLEITCGEAPYLVNRYDVSSGEILPIANRKHDDRSRMAQMDATRLPSHLWLRVPGRQLAHRTRQPPHDFRRLSRIAMASQTDVQRIQQIHLHDYLECLANGRALELHTLFLGRRRSSPNELVRFITSPIEAPKDQ